ncbi:hypothetical protein IWW40_003471 [Coemansia sp. RSA 1250]|nr:hypothetical protein IWW40_003471 [Coemansia sp. RSA 1250]
MPQFIVYFAQYHEDFRLAELEALSKLENVAIEYDASTYSLESPFLIVNINSAEEATKLVRRGILVRNIIEYWGHGSTYEELFARVKENPEKWADFKTCSFKFNVEAFGRTLTQKEKVAIINTFKFLAFEGPIRMKNPDAEFIVREEYPVTNNASQAETPAMIWFGRLVGQGSRELIDKFDVKKRRYLGNTTMDAELSLVMANQALARPGTLVYDPFVGTGSFLLTCSHFGACSMGSDIDGRQIRGTAGFRLGVDGISANFEQYGVGDRVLDTAVFDICRNPWRSGPMFDAIVTDPPYGVRAGAKRLGRKDGTNPDISFKIVEGVENYKREDYYPPTIPYEMSDLVSDLLEFAAEKLVVGGRLVYWLPTVADEYDPKDIPEHPALKLVANSEQPFRSWSRRLITMEKIAPLESSHKLSTPEHNPAHKNFPVVGGGAAGFYTAARLLAKTTDVNIDIFEKLPAPHGLVRYGVAPDHPEVKNCMSKFDEVANNARVRYFGNVAIDGHDKPSGLSVNMLRSVYDGVVLSYGASEDRRLNIPGEDGHENNVGVISARRFVAWYNGLPEAQDLEPDLTSHDRVVIIGHGNVALDCARILLTPPHVLEKTDITSNATDKLKQSKIRHVEMVGRRGPLQVSFTTKELREMTKIENVQIVSDVELVNSECESSEGRDYLSQMRPLKRMMDLLRKHAVSPTDPRATQASKTFTLKFLMSPQEVVYDGDMQKLRFQANGLEGSPADARAVAKDATVDIPCAMALRSIGYASTPLDGVPFDAKRRLVPNIAGRVIDNENNVVEGLYVSGWIKRGPVGVIATTMQDAYRTADAIVMDLANNAIGHSASQAKVNQMLAQANIDQNRVSNEGWKRLEQFEFAAGEARGKPREKVTSVQKMLDIIRDK